MSGSSKIRRSGAQPSRIGGIALKNGLVLVTERYWAAAVRETDGEHQRGLGRQDAAAREAAARRLGRGAGTRGAAGAEPARGREGRAQACPCSAAWAVSARACWCSRW